MIRSLRGRVVDKRPNFVVVEAAGVGYGLAVPLSTSGSIGKAGEEVFLFVTMRVREDSMELFGFATAKERDLFEAMLRIRGLPARTALSILSHCGMDDFSRALASGDLDTLTKVPGVGKKSAQKILLEMAGELVRTGPGSAEEKAALRDDAVEALVTLGYRENTARGAVGKAREILGDGADLSEIIKKALSLV